MYILFFVCLLGVIAAIPLHFMSIEHLRLQKKYGNEEGVKISEIYGRLSAYLLFFSLIGIWFSCQPKFTVPIFQNLSILIPVVNFSIPWIHLIISALFILPGVWLLSNSVRGLSRRVSETHRPEKVITAGIYAVVRHPQHLGWLSTHVGFSFLLSAWYSLLFTPLLVGLLYLISRKEEEELIREFGEEYEKYKKKTPMLIPGLRNNVTI